MMKIRERYRINASPKGGADVHRQAWTEYQVVEGRRVLSRHDLPEQASRWIAKEIERRAKAGRTET